MNDEHANKKSLILIKQVVRYAFIGIFSNLVGYMIYLMLTFFGATPKTAMTFLYGLGAAVGYIGNRRFTFAHHGNLLTSGARYLLAHFLGYLINLLMLVVCVDYFGYRHQWVQAAAILVVAGFLFIAFRFFVFADSDSNSMNINKS